MQYMEVWQSDYKDDIAVKITKMPSDFKNGLKSAWHSYLIMSDPSRSYSNIITYLIDNKKFLDNLIGWNRHFLSKSFKIDIETNQRFITIGGLERAGDRIFEEIEREIYKIREQAFDKFRSVGVLK